jgi:hypothetical protein
MIGRGGSGDLHEVHIHISVTMLLIVSFMTSVIKMSSLLPSRKHILEKSFAIKLLHIHQFNREAIQRGAEAIKNIWKRCL